MVNVTTVVTVLAPAFAVGLGIQHLNELLDAAFSSMAGKDNNNKKKLLMGISSLVFAGVATGVLDLHIVQLLTDGSRFGGAFQFMDRVVTALIISTGTEGINSIVKFLGYAKDQKKATAAQLEGAAGAAISLVNRQP